MSSVARLGWLAMVVAASAGVVGLWRWADRLAARDRTVALSGAPSRTSFLSRWLSSRLAAAGVAMDVGDVVQLWGAVTVGAAVVASSFDARLVVGVGIAAALGGPCWLRVRTRRQSMAAVRALPEALRGIAAELRIGGTVQSGLATLAESGSALAGGAGAVCRRTELGAELDSALGRWGDELASPAARAMVGALALAVHVGGPAAAALDGLASSLSDQFDAQEELRAQSAQARASATVMVVAPLGYLLFAAMIDQHGFDVLVSTTIGRSCLVAGVLLDGLAWWWIRVLVRDRFAQ